MMQPHPRLGGSRPLDARKHPLLMRAGFSLLGTLLLSGLIWWLGPLLPPLEPASLRVVIILALLAVWSGSVGWLLWRGQRANAELASGLLTDDATAETEALQRRFADALGLLRRAGGAGALRRQPWYVIIGPPGAGKTTALLNAGLRFPLSSELGQGPVAGVGGTRHCDWWFTDQAVLIDTAGRYTTQDSGGAIDRAGWQAFLDLLARTRKRQPLNGVIVALPVLGVANASPEQRTAHSRTIRDRLAEIDARLGVRLPVYILLTKADLIAGFAEFFEDLDTERRGQVWGTTFALPPPGLAPKLDTATALAALVERLHAKVLARLQAERSPERRALIANFPYQVASLLDPLTAFVEETFADSKLKRAGLLRGVYLTSGTQDGTRIDRLTGLLSRTFGLDQRRIPSLRPQQGRSYFLHRLLAQVLPGEAMLVALPPAARRRRTILRAAAFAATLIATVGSCGGIWRAHNIAVAQQSRLRDALDAYAQEAARHRLDPVADIDLVGLLPLLDRARDLPFRAAVGSGEDRLDQRPELGAVAQVSYEHALDRTFLPRLLRRLEMQIAGALDRPDAAYEATRIYLMLGGAGPLDTGLVRTWMRLDWQAAYPGPAFGAARDRLALHLDALLAQPVPTMDLDGDLVRRARDTFGRVLPAERVYRRIQASPEAQAVPGWRPRDGLGVLGAGLFIRGSGKSMDEPVPGFLTASGFRHVLLPALAPAIGAIASETWVLGPRAGPGQAPAALEPQVLALYQADFIRVWDGLLNDLQLVPLKSVSQAAEDLFVLQSPDSPMRSLLRAISQQVTLTDATPYAEASGGNAVENSGFKTIIPAFRPEGAAQPGSAVNAHYRYLHDLVGDGPGAPIDVALRSWTEVEQMLARAATTAGVQAAAPSGSTPEAATAALRAEAQRWPDPLRRWMQSMADGSASLLGTGER